MHSSRIVFLSTPESLGGKVITNSTLRFPASPDSDSEDVPEEQHLIEEGFAIDPAIPIPVELPPGEDTLNLEHLSWEMILSGMIRVIGEDYEARPGTSAYSREDIEYYRKFVLAVKPDIMGEFSEAAILKARNGDSALALEIIDALRGLFPYSPEVLLNRALILESKAEMLERSGQEEEAKTVGAQAEEAYRFLLEWAPSFSNGLFNAGFFYVKNQDYEKAKACFADFLLLSDDKRKISRAQRIIKEIEDRSLDDEMFHEAYEAIRSGETEQGILEIKDFLERHPQVWNGWFLLGWGLRKLRRWEDAAASLRKSLELGGDNSDARNELAICLMEMSEYPAAQRELELALRHEPDNVKIISNLGVLALKQGDREQAAAFFRAVLDLEPQDPIALQGLQAISPTEEDS